MTSTTGILSAIHFRANGCYDPDATGTGHQPYGWDQMTPFYNHYVVLGSRLTARVTPTGAASGNAVAVGVYLADDTSIPFTAYTTYIEANRGTYRMMTYHEGRSSTVSCNFSAKKFFNLTDVKDNTDRIGASVVTDPSEQAIFSLWCQSADQTSTSNTLNLVVTIDYIVAFSEPKDVDVS